MATFNNAPLYLRRLLQKLVIMFSFQHYLRLDPLLSAGMLRADLVDSSQNSPLGWYNKTVLREILTAPDYVADDSVDGNKLREGTGPRAGASQTRSSSEWRREARVRCWSSWGFIRTSARSAPNRTSLTGTTCADSLVQVIMTRWNRSELHVVVVSPLMTGNCKIALKYFKVKLNTEFELLWHQSMLDHFMHPKNENVLFVLLISWCH